MKICELLDLQSALLRGNLSQPRGPQDKKVFMGLQKVVGDVFREVDTGLEGFLEVPGEKPQFFGQTRSLELR